MAPAPSSSDGLTGSSEPHPGVLRWRVKFVNDLRCCMSTAALSREFAADVAAALGIGSERVGAVEHVRPAGRRGDGWITFDVRAAGQDATLLTMAFTSMVERLAHNDGPLQQGQVSKELDPRQGVERFESGEYVPLRLAPSLQPPVPRDALGAHPPREHLEQLIPSLHPERAHLLQGVGGRGAGPFATRAAGEEPAGTRQVTVRLAWPREEAIRPNERRMPGADSDGGSSSGGSSSSSADSGSSSSSNNWSLAALDLSAAREAVRHALPLGGPLTSASGKMNKLRTRGGPADERIRVSKDLLSNELLVTVRLERDETAVRASRLAARSEEEGGGGPAAWLRHEFAGPSPPRGAGEDEGADEATLLEVVSSDTFPDALAAGLGLPPKSITRSAEPQLKSHIPWASYHTSDVYSRHAAVLQDEELILAPSSSSSPTGRPYWLSERLFGGSSNSGGYDARLSDQPGPPPTNFATNATLIIGAQPPGQPYFVLIASSPLPPFSHPLSSCICVQAC